MSVFSLKLPGQYRAQEVLAFHGRDREGLAEQVEAGRIHKGLMMDGVAVVLTLSLADGRAACHVDADGPLPHRARYELRRTARNMLGLHIDPEPFETMAQLDPLLGPLVQKQLALRIPQAATPFEALTWAIIGQQINLPFAITLRRAFILLAGRRHSSGLWCYPDASAAARISPEELGRRKFSRAKAETLVRVARLVESSELPLTRWQNSSPQQIETALLAIKGIGPWTVNYTLLRGFGSPDCSLHGDSAIKSALQKLAGSPGRPDASEARVWLERYRPHRSLTAAHLWASLHVSA